MPKDTLLSCKASRDPEKHRNRFLFAVFNSFSGTCAQPCSHLCFFLSFYLLFSCSPVFCIPLHPTLFFHICFLFFIFISFYVPYLRLSISQGCLLDCFELQTTLSTSLFLAFLSNVQLFTCGMSLRLSPVTSHFPQALPTTPTFADFALLWFPPSLLFKKDKVS